MPLALDVCEALIAGSILDQAASRGLLVSVFDGEEWAVRLSSDRAALDAAIGATGETMLVLRDPDNLDDRGNPGRVGSVVLIHGNGADVIHDYSDDVEMIALLAPVLALVERLSVAHA